MKKNLKYFGITWIVVLIIFNAVTFLIPNQVLGVTRFDKLVFWIAYALIMLSFVVQLMVACKFIKADSNEKKFLKIPLLKTAYAAIIVSFTGGLIFMVFPVLPAWIGAIVCLLVAGYFVIACVKADTVANVVADIDEKVKSQTAFIRTVTVDAENIMACATTPETKAECKKVYEALRYSDPMSDPALGDIEQEISKDLEELKNAVMCDDSSKVSSITSSILLNVKARNSKCKMLKGGL